MQNVSMGSVSVCQSTTVTPILIVAQNVCSVPTAIRIKHAFEGNALILVSAHVGKTQSVKLLTTSLCAVAFQGLLEIHLFCVTQLKVHKYTLIYILHKLTIHLTIYFFLQSQHMRILATLQYVGLTASVD